MMKKYEPINYQPEMIIHFVGAFAKSCQTWNIGDKSLATLQIESVTCEKCILINNIPRTILMKEKKDD